VRAMLRTVSRWDDPRVRLRPLHGGFLVSVAAAAFLTCPAAAATLSLKSPTRAALAVAGTPIIDSVLPTTTARRLMAAAASWGGTYTASTGEQVTITVSNAYPQDQAVPQRWANFLASLVHGSELSTVRVYLAPLSEVQSYCGPDALACYNPQNSLLVTPGDDPAANLTAEAVVTHEYGHHIANSRSDAPWDAIDYGTKRWSSYMQVCAKAEAGQYFPGAEQNSRYQLNPGEGFAESYRVLNERKAGIPETPWQVVSTALYPDATALSLIQQDVLSPWTGNTKSTLSTSLSRRARARTLSVSTPLDGKFAVTIRAAKGERVTADLYSASGARVGHTVVTGTGARTLSTTTCGSRSYSVKLTRKTGSGAARLVVSKA
jgi:hypothetical protein